MSLNPIRKALGMRQKPIYYPPVMKGPPENPEYFILLHKPGQYPKFEMEERHYLRNTEEEERLFALRRARYAALFPDKKPHLDYGFSYQNSTLEPGHLPKFLILKKKVNLAEYMIPYLALGNGPIDYDVFRLVRPAFKAAIEELNSNLCQFFPFEFRTRTGEVIENFFIVHFPKKHFASIVMKKSGASENFYKKELVTDVTVTWSRPDEDVIRKGQLIIRRPQEPGLPLYFCGDRWWVYSKALLEKIGSCIPLIDEFYPVHIEEDV
jgi:hypothetical protein